METLVPQIRTSPCTANYNIRIVTCHFHLFQSFETDNCLMHQHMVKYTSQGIFNIIISCCNFNCFRDGNPKTSCRIRVLGQVCFTKLSLSDGEAMHVAPKGFHHCLAIRFLLETDLYHVNLNLQSKNRTSKGQ